MISAESDVYAPTLRQRSSWATPINSALECRSRLEAWKSPIVRSMSINLSRVHYKTAPMSYPAPER